ncbi:hypothetical protein BHE74_00018304 [Ensete ventricosum]|nr:hypothetical protein BHE74_00018304 [Ensete ventricosum]
MFEGVVSQVLAGYLGRFVKGIQKDQLKIGIWNALTSQYRGDRWSSDSVEKRELAGKMAKLNAIELAKLSRRVSGELLRCYDS